MLYQRYQNARDAAWRTLLRFEIDSLPVDAERIAKGLGITPESWPEKVSPFYALLPQGAAAASLRISGVWHVYMQPGLSYSRYCFALAHELGHLILQHPTRKAAPAVYTFDGAENQGDLMDDPHSDCDLDADMFAIRLLAPACVLHCMHVLSPGQLAALCNLPPKAAALRAQRIALLDQRNVYYTHPLEKQLARRFRPYLQREAVPAPEPRPITLPQPMPERAVQQGAETEKPARFPLIAAVMLCGAAILLLLLPKIL